jgi:hypothetical protein
MRWIPTCGYGFWRTGWTDGIDLRIKRRARPHRVIPGRQRYSSSRERRLQELADADSADSDELAAGVTPVQVWAIGQAMLVGLQIERRLAPGLVTPEVFERAFGLLADLYQEQ